MEELIRLVVNKDDAAKPKFAPASEVSNYSLHHVAVGAFLFDETGRVLLKQTYDRETRLPKNLTHPIHRHVLASETLEDAVFKGVRQDLGGLTAGIRWLTDYDTQNSQDNERISLYTGLLYGDMRKVPRGFLWYRPEELSRAMILDFGQFDPLSKKMYLDLVRPVLLSSTKPL